jgi:hypothetical protein
MPTPSEKFVIFSQFLVSSELVRHNPVTTDEVKKRLWQAAQFDAFFASGGIPYFRSDVDGKSLADGFDHFVDSSEYEAAINKALLPIKEWRGESIEVS